jgi:hypothetical protein
MLSFKNNNNIYKITKESNSSYTQFFEISKNIDIIDNTVFSEDNQQSNYVELGTFSNNMLTSGVILQLSLTI